MANIRIEEYDWGTLRVIEVGIDYKVIIHPEDASWISRMEPEDVLPPFIDEQGNTWGVKMDPLGMITFYDWDSSRRWVSVPREDLKFD